MANRKGKSVSSDRFYFLGLQNHCDCSHEIKRHLLLGRKARINLDSVLKSKDITSLTKVRMYSYGFPVVIFNVNWCFWILVLDKTLESPLDRKEIKPVSPKGNQPWIFTGRSNTEAEAPMLWPPDAKNQLIGKDPDAWKDWGQEKGVTEDEMAGSHHRLNGHEFEQTLGDSEGQGSLVCCSPWGHKEYNSVTGQHY